MFGAIAFAVLVVSLLGMGLVTWLYDRYEAPLHAQQDAPATDDDLVLVRRAKHNTKTGDQRLN